MRLQEAGAHEALPTLGANTTYRILGPHGRTAIRIMANGTQSWAHYATRHGALNSLTKAVNKNEFYAREVVIYGVAGACRSCSPEVPGDPRNTGP